ncbi:Kunitz/Bovine pancreatic trypsin inhibitor domain protein [Ostertagia ostertagi]
MTSKLLPTHSTDHEKSTSTEVSPTTEDVLVENKTDSITPRVLKEPKDLCDEPLNPKLEEDCNNENWELKWYFNKARGACKSFWYGGCETTARNFFGDFKSCRTTCGHKYPNPEEALNPAKFRHPPVVLEPSPTSAIATSSPPSDVMTSSDVPNSLLMTTAVTPSEFTTDFVRNVDSAPHTVPIPTTEESAAHMPSTQSSTLEEVIIDICIQGYDPKWDEVNDV